jgi:cytochrome oxidase assembly protein ShyY1
MSTSMPFLLGKWNLKEQSWEVEVIASLAAKYASAPKMYVQNVHYNLTNFLIHSYTPAMNA